MKRRSYLIRDRDQTNGAIVTRRLRAMGIRDKPIAPASPWQNGFAERLIGSIRRQCLDHLIVLGEAHLRRMLQAYGRYYNDIVVSALAPGVLKSRGLARQFAPIGPGLGSVNFHVDVPV